MNKFYFIECWTGCTCCREENHIRGPYLTKEDAERRIAYFKSPDSKFWPVASQYCKRGSYTIEEEDYEVISNNRIIIGNRVFQFPKGTIVVAPDGTVADHTAEYFTNEW